MTSKYAHYKTDALKALLEKANNHLAGAIMETCEILLELHKRGERHPYMREGVLRWFESIAKGRLSIHAAIAFAGVGTIIRKLDGMDLLQQQALANGGKVVIAEHDAAGKVVRAEKPILQLTTRQLDLAFDAGMAVPFEKQRKILAARSVGPDKRRSSVALNFRADPEKGEIICGQMRIDISDPGFLSALNELGFQIVRKTKKAA